MGRKAASGLLTEHRPRGQGHNFTPSRAAERGVRGQTLSLQRGSAGAALLWRLIHSYTSGFDFPARGALQRGFAGTPRIGVLLRFAMPGGGRVSGRRWPNGRAAVDLAAVDRNVRPRPRIGQGGAVLRSGTARGKAGSAGAAGDASPGAVYNTVRETACGCPSDRSAETLRNEALQHLRGGRLS